MATNSKIEWTTHTFNPWEGCTKVSPGCAHCYAETRNARFGGGNAPNWGRGAPRRRTSEHNWNLPLKWNREAACKFDTDRDGNCHIHPQGCPRPRVFCASLADWLDDEVPIAWLVDLLDLIRTTPHLDWLMLTKRPQNFRPRLQSALNWILNRHGGEPSSEADFIDGWIHKQDTIPHNVWFGTTVEDQTRAEERIPLLLDIPAKVRFLSCEPLLGHVDLTRYTSNQPSALSSGKIHWVICGGESGPGARPVHPDWARTLRDQCLAANVPFFFKQWGEYLPICMDPPEMIRVPDGEDWHKGKPSIVVQLDGSHRRDFPPGAMTCIRLGKSAAGRLLDGIEWNQYPTP